MQLGNLYALGQRHKVFYLVFIILIAKKHGEIFLIRWGIRFAKPSSYALHHLAKMSDYFGVWNMFFPKNISTLSNVHLYFVFSR